MQRKRLVAIKATVGHDRTISYLPILDYSIGDRDKFGDASDGSLRQYVDEANRLQDEFDKDGDPVRVYIYVGPLPIGAARSSKYSLCHILQLTDGGTVQL